MNRGQTHFTPDKRLRYVVMTAVLRKRGYTMPSIARLMGRTTGNVRYWAGNHHRKPNWMATEFERLSQNQKRP